MKLSVQRLSAFLTGITLVLALVYGALGIYYTGSGTTSTLYELFRMDREANVPTWYSSVLLLLTGLSAFLVAGFTVRQPATRYWWGLGGLFVYLSLDETAQLHERWEYLYEPWTRLGGPFLYGWVVPAMALVVVAGLLYLRFFLRLPARVKLYFFMGAALYVGGAVGAEMLQAYITYTSGLSTLTGVINLVEETAEMLGANAFLYAFLLYLKELPEKAFALS